MNDQSCNNFSQLIPELALGCLGGRERAATLGHARRCLHCRQELAACQALAGELLDLIPAAAPPAGFELRALGAMKTPQAAPGPAPAVTGHRRRRLLAAALIAATVMGGFGLGRLVSPHPPLHTATLTAEGRHIGTAYFYAGTQPWIWLNVDLGSKTQTVTCELQSASGHKPVDLGTFGLTAGQGSWGFSTHIQWQHGTRALILNGAHQTIASAVFRS
jgi:hypothetical protein